jgi:hypothetical protein
LQQNQLGYCLYGRSFKKHESCLNCTTAVFKVLEAGGLDKIPGIDDMITSPGGLRDVIKQAEVNQQKPSQTNS